MIVFIGFSQVVNGASSHSRIKYSWCLTFLIKLASIILEDGLWCRGRSINNDNDDDHLVHLPT